MMEILTNLDGNLLLWIQENLRVEFLNGFWKFVTSLADGGIFWIILGVSALAFKRTRPVGIAMLLALIINHVATNMILKDIFQRPRPFVTFSEIIPLIDKPGSFSFPSGHTSTSFAAAFAVLFMEKKRRYAIPAMIIAAMIGFSRMYVGVHYPGDILGGIVIGILSAFVASAIVKLVGVRLRKKHDKA